MPGRETNEQQNVGSALYSCDRPGHAESIIELRLIAIPAHMFPASIVRKGVTIVVSKMFCFVQIFELRTPGVRALKVTPIIAPTLGAGAAHLIAPGFESSLFVRRIFNHCVRLARMLPASRRKGISGEKMLLPRKSVPDLRVPTLEHGEFDLAADGPEQFTLICFYRGLHCPVCLKYLRELGTLIPEYERRGTKVIAISSDTPERAQEMASKVKAGNLRFGHSLPLTVAREWGLYISSSRGQSSIGIEEPPLFSEPAVYLVRADGTLYYGAVQTMPFARPLFSELLQAIDFAIIKDYPARGEYDGPV